MKIPIGNIAELCSVIAAISETFPNLAELSSVRTAFRGKKQLQRRNSGTRFLYIAMVSMPTFKDAPTVGSQAYLTYFPVTKLSEHIDEAAEVINYLISDEYQMEMSRKGMMTILKDEQTRMISMPRLRTGTNGTGIA